ncbi:MAG: hypothetical protein Tsb009_01900 [Planctomycetaceae bacterium]
MVSSSHPFVEQHLRHSVRIDRVAAKFPLAIADGSAKRTDRQLVGAEVDEPSVVGLAVDV